MINYNIFQPPFDRSNIISNSIEIKGEIITLLEFMKELDQGYFINVIFETNGKSVVYGTCCIHVSVFKFSF
jgi:hypothetical protein